MVVLPELGGASFVAMMGVDPRHRRRGLGRALLEHAMQRAAPPFMLYASDQGRPLYERLGYRAVDVVRRFAGVAGPARVLGAVRPATPADLPRILEADARACGLRRSRVLERLVAVAERVVVEPGGGFAIRWNCGALSAVGPVVAADEEAA